MLFKTVAVKVLLCPCAIVFDNGESEIVIAGGNSVTELSSTGSVIGRYGVGTGPYSLGDMTGFALQYFVLGRR